jgi:hypothetical protein
VYFTWEGEAGALQEAGIEIPDVRTAEQVDDLEIELRILERTLAEAGTQITRIRELMEEARRAKDE